MKPDNDVHKEKIAFIIPSLGAGGAERVVSTLANGLIHKYDIVIISFINDSPFYKLDPGIKVSHCVEAITPSKNVIQALKNNYILLKRLDQILKQERVDLAIGFLTSANVLTVLASKRIRIPCIISERIHPEKTYTPGIWKLLRRFTYKRADFMVVQTKEIQNFYNGKVPAFKLKILPNPIAQELTDNIDPGIPKTNTILNVGRLSEQKAQNILIEAFAEIENDSWELVIIGDGEKKETYKKLIRGKNLNGSVKLLGNTRKISDHYNKSKIFAFTSIYEGFPNALIEALHYGLACISTDCPTGPSELIENGKNGYLIPVNDKEALKEKLAILMNNEKDRITFGKEGQKIVEIFKAQSVVSKWDQLIEQCLKNKKT